jgi:hypothetical protein
MDTKPSVLLGSSRREVISVDVQLGLICEPAASRRGRLPVQSLPFEDAETDRFSVDCGGALVIF